MKLSANDAAVLSSLFEPESHPSAGVMLDSDLPSLPGISQDTFIALQARETAILKPINTNSPSKSDVEAAISAISAIIEENPSYPSAYANRAQATRLLLSDSDVFSASNDALITRIVADLRRAISLSSPTSRFSGAMSPFQANLLAAAHSHLGYLYLKASELAKRDGRLEAGPRELRELRSERLEEMASVEFEKAGKFGDGVAKEMAVRTNPYAKMCGAIVREAVRKEREGMAVEV